MFIFFAKHLVGIKNSSRGKFAYMDCDKAKIKFNK